jgi:hypothetical protein
VLVPDTGAAAPPGCVPVRDLAAAVGWLRAHAPVHSDVYGR